MWVDAPTGRRHFSGLVIRTHLEAIITSRRFQSAPQPQNAPPTPADLKGCAANAVLWRSAGAVLGLPVVAWAECLGRRVPWYTAVWMGTDDRTQGPE